MSPAEKKCYFDFDMAKNVNIKLSGDEFFMKSISKIMVPLQSPGFLLYVVEFAIPSFCDIRETFTLQLCSVIRN